LRFDLEELIVIDPPDAGDAGDAGQDAAAKAPVQVTATSVYNTFDGDTFVGQQSVHVSFAGAADGVGGITLRELEIRAQDVIVDECVPIPPEAAVLCSALALAPAAAPTLLPTTTKKG
jgi:hypothetical protein